MASFKRPIFTVQKHKASHLHYDFRLEIDGMLKSWAIPKGPSLDPSIKRLAVEVEDHELRYADFEGVIEEGHYGAGPVLVWDMGWFEPLPSERVDPSPTAMHETGKIGFLLHGHRLRGGFSLVRMKGRPRQWLLLKQGDGAARPGTEITEKYQTSVLTGRTLEDLERQAAAGTLQAHRCG
jgi:bifunctional non-homologous end joining protein LigD